MGESGVSEPVGVLASVEGGAVALSGGGTGRDGLGLAGEFDGGEGGGECDREGDVMEGFVRHGAGFQTQGMLESTMEVARLCRVLGNRGSARSAMSLSAIAVMKFKDRVSAELCFALIASANFALSAKPLNL